MANQGYPNIQKAKIEVFGGSSFPLKYMFYGFGEIHVTRTREYSSHRKKVKFRCHFFQEALPAAFYQVGLGTIPLRLPSFLYFSVSVQITSWGHCPCPRLLPSPQNWTHWPLGVQGPAQSQTLEQSQEVL